ncbi:MAG: DUF6653 family protein [Chloroflexota bacterium]|jgi:hypothetical protein
MTLEEKIARSFSMSEETWQRHANPWSVWTRFTALPLIILAAWSRVWLRRWALIPIALSLLWTWLNPRIFSKPRSTDNWASKAVLGERVWLNRNRIPIPGHHSFLPNLLNVVSGVGGAFVVWGVAALRVWPTLFGSALVFLGKLWFIDRMVWLYEEMKEATPEYKSWLY